MQDSAFAKKNDGSLRSNRISFIVAAGLILIASLIRIKIYGDPRLSIAGNDTQSYVDSSSAALFSPEIMTGRRLLTTNLIYKILEPKEGYQILANGSLETQRRVFQPGFDRIVLLQIASSILGWGCLAFMFARHLQNPLMKVLSAVMVMLFAYLPQMADWDSILMSESLTFSLFVLLAAISMHMAFSLYKSPKSNLTGVMIVWGIVYFFWTFLRDTNLFATLALIMMVTPIMMVKPFRGNKSLQALWVLMALTFALGLTTASMSVRSTVQLRNIFIGDIFPSETRVAIFKEMGMPEPQSAEFEKWLPQHGNSALLSFMLKYPGYPILTFVQNFSMSFVEIKQTYFHMPEAKKLRAALLEIGDALHPESTSAFLISFLLLIGISAIAAGNPEGRPWAWLCLWLFLTSSITLIPTILGDTWAINRHALFSTMIYRLSMWVFAIIAMDLALMRPRQDPAQPG